jgi:putative transposase
LYYKPKPKNDAPVIDKLSVLAERHPTYGFWKMYDMIRLEQLIWNHKRVHRIYVDIGLNIRRKKKRRLPVAPKEPLTWPIDANIVWSMDFIHDTLVVGLQRTRTQKGQKIRDTIYVYLKPNLSSK